LYLCDALYLDAVIVVVVFVASSLTATRFLALCVTGYTGENALARYDQTAYNTIESQSHQGVSSFTYLRLNPTLMQSNNFGTFSQFVSAMKNL
jgi:hypothetical protein